LFDCKEYLIEIVAHSLLKMMTLNVSIGMHLCMEVVVGSKGCLIFLKDI